ncbi:hypothetical protein [Sediminicola luteus]|uniref:EamA domain-containing protein n=1 Tax=Sediminicola luteus TaxID=319238 RepID=A0A2A4G4S0_9FLAO|nr:hypothetical protein [Sediminicola luteus]PCE63657.1 hypothetical protein B7P33_10250 [Sediminicola luteus]
MWHLLLSVACSTFIFLVFKLYPVYKVNTFYAIVTNYWVAFAVGWYYYNGELGFTEVFSMPWFPYTLALGVLFISIFNLMAKTSQTVGVSVASVATKMSLVIPVVLAVWLYKEQMGILRFTGILLALAAVYFASIKESKSGFSYKMLVWPVLVFLGSGAIDASLQYFENNMVAKTDLPVFSATIFGAAGCTGLLIMGYKLFRNATLPKVKDGLGGLALGVPNFFSIFFLLKALGGFEETSVVFTVNNVAIVMVTTLLGIVLFQEKLSTKNWIGISMAVISIVMVAYF